MLAVQDRDGYALENVAGLRQSVEATRAERDEAAQKHKAFEGVDPKAVKSLQEKAQRYDQMEGEAAKVKEQFESWKEDFKAEVSQQHQQELEAATNQAQAYRQQLENQLVRAQATQILSDPKVNGNPALLLPVIRDMTATRENSEGQLEVIVLNPAKPGQARVGKSGGNMTLAELIEELKANDQFADAFRVERSGPGGKAPEGGSRGDGNLQRSKMRVEDKAAYIAEHGREAYQRLPW